MIRNEFFEVPFIAAYRKELVEPEIWNADVGSQNLWKIYEMDEKVSPHFSPIRLENLGKFIITKKHRSKNYTKDDIYKNS